MPPRQANSRTAVWRADRALAVLAIAASVVAAAIFVHLARLRPPQSHLWGDEGTYVAMASSLARDLDLAFSEEDRQWALERGGDKGVAVILQRTPRGIAFSKPVLYPLLGALPYRVSGESGLLLVNALALAAGVLFAWLYLRRIGAGGHLWLTLVAFAGYAAVAPYLAWRMSESLQVGLALTGLTLACGALRRTSGRLGRLDRLLENRAAPLAGGVALGLLSSMRASNAVLVLGAALACLLVAGRRRALSVIGGAAAALLVVLGLSLALLGSVSPYTAERTSFNAKIGYPVGPGAEHSLGRFDARPATHRFSLKTSGVSLHSAYYFVVGRHTGLLAYFPLALVLLYMLARHPDRLGLAMLGSVLALACFYLLYMPHNYFGGSTFVGNRYFLVSYPALLIGASRLPPPRLLVATLLIGLLFGGSALASVERTGHLDRTSQSHAAAGAFLALPYESTAIEIQGQKSRFWSRDYVRFTTPMADVGRKHFTLHSDRPAAELMIASRRPRDRMYFLVRPPGVVRVIDWSDWARGGSAPARRGARIAADLVSFRPATAWREHRFWWRNEDLYDVRVLRLGIEPRGIEPRRADVYYLGGDDTLLASAGRTVVQRQLPARGVAGRRGRLRLRVRNTSETAWSPDAVLPVMVGYRLETPERVVASAKRPIDRTIRRGEHLDIDLIVDWPDEPGSYRLIVDLSLHPVYWFAQKLGKPLAARTVEIGPAP